MFETAELGLKTSKKEYNRRVPLLREQLLQAQADLRGADFPVLVLFAGVDGAGKGELANLLSSWMDPRRIVTRAFGRASQEELERPEFWRYWRDLPPAGHLGIFLSAWYTKPLLDRVQGRSKEAELDARLARIASFERTLVENGGLILKFWMHLGKKQQEHRFKALEKDPRQKWRVTKKDWEHWRLYERFVAAAERIIRCTSSAEAPWTIVEGADEEYRSLRVGELLLAGIRRRLDECAPRPTPKPSEDCARGDPAPPREAAPEDGVAIPGPLRPRTVLERLDLSQKLHKKEYRAKLEKLQGRLNRLHRRARSRHLSTILAFEGWDAGGKGGAIRRVTAALDARDYQVISIAAPTDEERSHHYLWRFWRHLSRAGRVTIFDRSWYGRVLVERVEGFAAECEWRRAYSEICDFESQLVEHGIVLVKYWLHISREEQARRFQEREQTAYKAWKLTEEDWRNRAKWSLYEQAVHDMVERTSTEIAPWHLIAGEDKRFARVAVLETLCQALERALERPRGKS